MPERGGIRLEHKEGESRRRKECMNERWECTSVEKKKGNSVGSLSKERHRDKQWQALHFVLPLLCTRLQRHDPTEFIANNNRRKNTLCTLSYTKHEHAEKQNVLESTAAGTGTASWAPSWRALTLTQQWQVPHRSGKRTKERLKCSNAPLFPLFSLPPIFASPLLLEHLSKRTRVSISSLLLQRRTARRDSCDYGLP